jgi:hypothetical protein
MRYSVTDQQFAQLLTIAKLFALAHPYPRGKKK